MSEADPPDPGLLEAAVALLGGGGLLALMCLGAAYKWELDAQFVCAGDNCVEDHRNWVEAHLLPSVVVVLLLELGLILLVAHAIRGRRLRAEGARQHER